MAGKPQQPEHEDARSAGFHAERDINIYAPGRYVAGRDIHIHGERHEYTPRFTAPPPPPHFVQRPAEFDALVSRLLAADCTQPVAITTATLLHGAGGFGKPRPGKYPQRYSISVSRDSHRH